MISGRFVFRAVLTVWIGSLPLLFGEPDDSVCAKCHAKEVAAYHQSKMGNSIAPPAPLGPGKFSRRATRTQISITERDGHMIHTLTENGLAAEYPVAYQIGAGKVGYTYVVQMGSYLFESPASWYQKGGWDFSPGYQRMPNVDFERVIDSACLFCHADSAKFATSEGRRYSGGTLQPIGCDRCHGPGEAHALAPSAKNIVNPAKLTPRARNSVCEQCHLEGETRLLNPGKSWQDYHPGEELERTAVTYILTENHHEVRTVAQSEQLALSKCVQASGGKLWCATCHKPHGEVEISSVCKSCHATFSGAPKEVHAAVTECVSCHMPRLTPEDIPHTASTDHRIVRRPVPLPNFEGVGAEISAWQDPPAAFRTRDLAVAALVVGGTHNLTSVRSAGVELLEKLPASEVENDISVLSSLVSVKLKNRETEKAKEFARREVQLRPDSSLASMDLANALAESGDMAGAEQQLLKTIEIDPSQQQAWMNLTFLYEKQGRLADRIALLDRYLAWNPQNIWFRRLKSILSQP
jgi:hypothetical protein